MKLCEFMEKQGNPSGFCLHYCLFKSNGTYDEYMYIYGYLCSLFECKKITLDEYTEFMFELRSDYQEM